MAVSPLPPPPLPAATAAGTAAAAAAAAAKITDSRSIFEIFLQKKLEFAVVPQIAPISPHYGHFGHQNIDILKEIMGGSKNTLIVNHPVGHCETS